MTEEEIKRREEEFFASIPKRANRQDYAVAPSTAGELLACVLRSFLQEHQRASNANKIEGDRKAPPPVCKGGKALLPPTTIAEAASDLLEDCQVCGYPPGPQLTALLQELLGTDRPRLGASREYAARDRAAWLLAEAPSLSARKIAKEVGVVHTSVMAWLKDPKFQQLVQTRRHLVARLRASGQWPSQDES